MAKQDTLTPLLAGIPEDGLELVQEARHHDPFALLGRHEHGESAYVMTFLPRAKSVRIVEGGTELEHIDGTDFFLWRGPRDQVPEHYRLEWQDQDGHHRVEYDPYCFSPQLGDLDLHLFSEGRHWHAYRFLGSHAHLVDGISGVRFAVWAPSAERVSVVGDFNHWDGRRHAMRARGGSGVWETFIPGLTEGTV